MSTYAEQIEGAKTQIAFIIIDKRNGERTIIWKRDKKLAYSPEEAPLEIVAKNKNLPRHAARYACLYKNGA